MTLDSAYAGANSPVVGAINSRRPASAFVFGSLDIAMGALIILAGSQGLYRFVSTLGVWLIIYAFVGSKLLLNFNQLAPVIQRNLAILAFPFVATISAIWSVTPSASAYSSLQLLVTYCAGFWMGWRFRPRDIIFITVLGLTPLIVLSLINAFTGAFGDVYATNGGLLGIFGNKNTLGRMALFLAISSMALLFLKPFRLPMAMPAAGVFGASILALILSKSATSELILIGCIGVFMVLSLRNFRMTIRVFLAALFSAGLLGAGFVIVYTGIDPMDSVLDIFGKSSSLTGRTLLWQVASEEIATRPWLGTGFHNYWSSGQFAGADQIQRIFGSGLISFHNFILDIWVGLGVPGIVGISITLGAIFLTYTRYYTVAPNAESAFMMAMYFGAIGVASFNPLLHGQHGNVIVLLIAFAVSAQIEMRRKPNQQPPLRSVK